MKTAQNFPEIRRKSCKTCSKLHHLSGSCVDVNIENFYAPRQADDSPCPLFVKTEQEFFPTLPTLPENTDD